MAIEVAKVELKTVQDASGLEACIRKGQFTADQVIAVIGKTEGNGGVNDFTRILADQAFRARAAEARQAQRSTTSRRFRWCGRAAATASSRRMPRSSRATSKTGPASKSRLAIGTAMSVELLPEDIGRPAMVEKVADAVKAAMKDAGIDDPKDVHYVQTKTPLLTIDSVQRRREARPARRLRGARFDGRVERHHRARHRGRARRGQDAEGRGDLPQPRPLFVGRVMLLGRRTDAGADRACSATSRAPAGATASAMRS